MQRTFKTLAASDFKNKRFIKRWAKPTLQGLRSAMGHVKDGTDAVLSYDCHLKEKSKDWLAYLNEREDNLVIENIRKNTMSGRPCGDEAFVCRLENLLGRKMRALPWDRPRKK